jgi:putative nucleotidyltransferase with HDIG domain
LEGDVKDDQSFLDIIDEYVDSDKLTLPPFDKTALRVHQEIQKPDVPVEKIEKLIIADPALSGQILKMANSAFFRGLTPVMTVRDAIVRLGLDEIIRMVMVLSQKKIYETKDTYIKNYRNILWHHALVCALSSQWVARKAGFENLTQEVFFAALLHDIGKLFLITVVEKIKESKQAPFIPSKAVVNEIIRSQHTVKGYQLLKKWNIPDQYCQVVKEHHDKKFDKENVPLVILRLVNKISRKVGLSMEDDTDTVSVVNEANFLGFSEIRLAQLELELEDASKQVHTYYQMGRVG